MNRYPTARSITGRSSDRWRPLLLAACVLLLTACQVNSRPVTAAQAQTPALARPMPANSPSGKASALSCPSGLVLQVLGSGGPEFTPGRASSAYLVRDHGKAVFLLDSGAGSLLRFAESGADWSDLKALLYSHFHADHSVELTGFIKASWFGQRRAPLPVFGPWGNRLMPSTEEFLARNIGQQNGAWHYLSDFLDASQKAAYRIQPHTIPEEQAADSVVFSADGWTVKAHKVTHGPLPALAWRLEKNGHSLVYSGDTNGQGLAILLKPGTDIFLAHNAIPENAGSVARALHMRPGQIGQLAASAATGLLVLSHRMHRTLGKEKETRQHIRKYWSGPIAFADDLDRYCID